MMIDIKFGSLGKEASCAVIVGVAASDAPFIGAGDDDADASHSHELRIIIISVSLQRLKHRTRRRNLHWTDHAADS